MEEKCEKLDKPEVMTVKQAAAELGLPLRMVRSFCDRGFVPGVRRINGYRRVLEAWQLDWIRTLVGLRRIGMSSKEIRKYMGLCRQGKITLSERKEMLETKKRQLWQQIEELQSGIDFVERKEEVIGRVLSGEMKAESDWL